MRAMAVVAWGAWLATRAGSCVTMAAILPTRDGVMRADPLEDWFALSTQRVAGTPASAALDTAWTGAGAEDEGVDDEAIDEVVYNPAAFRTRQEPGSASHSFFAMQLSPVIHGCHLGISLSHPVTLC